MDNNFWDLAWGQTKIRFATRLYSMKHRIWKPVLAGYFDEKHKFRTHGN